MLQPKRSKHRKAQKGRIREVAKRGSMVSFGSYGLKALEDIRKDEVVFKMNTILGLVSN